MGSATIEFFFFFTYYLLPQNLILKICTDLNIESDPHHSDIPSLPFLLGVVRRAKHDINTECQQNPELLDSYLFVYFLKRKSFSLSFIFIVG